MGELILVIYGATMLLVVIFLGFYSIYLAEKGAKMNIDREVKKYNDKKDRLLNNLVGRISAFSKEKEKEVQRLNVVIEDCKREKDRNLGVIQQAALAINSVVTSKS